MLNQQDRPGKMGRVQGIRSSKSIFLQALDPGVMNKTIYYPQAAREFFNETMLRK